jgi:hypothetical protein
MGRLASASRAETAQVSWRHTAVTSTDIAAMIVTHILGFEPERG